VDLTAVSKKLTSHPWIAEAVIIREIPDRIRIEIEEHKPVALVRGHHFFLMDSQGECFTRVTPSDYADLPIITGIEPATLGPDCNLSPDLTAQIKDLYRECRLQLPLHLISEIRWNRRHGLSLFTTQGGIQIDLGTGDYGSRLARLERVLHYLMDKGAQSQLRRIDLTHGDRVFVRGKFQVIPQNRPKQRGV
jgi:cell division septal protein FtsQ